MYISDGYNVFLSCPVDRFVPSSFVLFKLMVISHEWSGSVIDQVSLSSALSPACIQTTPGTHIFYLSFPLQLWLLPDIINFELAML
ncbi:hypothetical protein ACN42_g10799 [Penicillium freii]|uniref:Uncharacterized protein n=1 Tax=Penicillium freii TaxID=48697 RepID=A0A101M9E0_PENFR|nr:hypothetical protein ACN42_g10799 [Penicillium freii]